MIAQRERESLVWFADDVQRIKYSTIKELYNIKRDTVNQYGFEHSKVWDTEVRHLQRQVYFQSIFQFEGPGSSVSIATDYGLDGPGIESRWRQDFLHLSRLVLGPTQPPAQWVPGLSQGVKSSRGMTLTPHPLLVLWSRKGGAIPLLPLWAIRPVQSLSACTVELYLYSSCGPYGLYRASVPVQ
jgi:hypothetical protein